MKKYKCINCGNWYEEGNICKCRKKEDTKIDIFDKETENCIMTLDTLFLFIRALFIIIGIIYIIFILGSFFSAGDFKIIIICGLGLIAYIIICILLLTAINWKKLLLKNIFEIKKNTQEKNWKL